MTMKKLGNRFNLPSKYTTGGGGLYPKISNTEKGDELYSVIVGIYPTGLGQIVLGEDGNLTGAFSVLDVVLNYGCALNRVNLFLWGSTNQIQIIRYPYDGK